MNPPVMTEPPTGCSARSVRGRKPRLNDWRRRAAKPVVAGRLLSNLSQLLHKRATLPISLESR